MDKPCGVRVDGPLGRRFLRGLSLTRLWREGCGIALMGNAYKVSVMREGSKDGPALWAGGFVSLTALRAEGCGIALTGDEYEVSVTD